MNYSQKTFMAKSKNGWDWIDEKLIFDSFHDSQFSVHVLKDGNYLIIMRLWDGEIKKSRVTRWWDNKQGRPHRIIGKAIIKSSGEIVLPPTVFLKSNLSEYPQLYTSATTFINGNEFVMFPTFYNSICDKMAIKIVYSLEGNNYIGADITKNCIKMTQ
jgi:hypothetical protein